MVPYWRVREKVGGIVDKDAAVVIESFVDRGLEGRISDSEKIESASRDHGAVGNMLRRE